jgi:hypothetical protein
MNDQTMTTGLHTCGSLAVAHIEAAILAKASLVNMPCCYHKIDLGDLNLSTVAKQNPLPYNIFGLTLASGSHYKSSFQDIFFRNQVKYFRYTLHFLLTDVFHRPEKIALGTCPPQLYDGPFAVYAREQLSRLGLELNWNDRELNDYYAQEKNQEQIKQMLAAAIIRDVMGRVLETAIMIDRALWLEEHGYESQVFEIFDPTISPRNMVLEAVPSRG